MSETSHEVPDTVWQESSTVTSIRLPGHPESWGADFCLCCDSLVWIKDPRRLFSFSVAQEWLIDFDKTHDLEGAVLQGWGVKFEKEASQNVTYLDMIEHIPPCPMLVIETTGNDCYGRLPNGRWGILEKPPENWETLFSEYWDALEQHFEKLRCPMPVVTVVSVGQGEIWKYGMNEALHYDRLMDELGIAMSPFRWRVLRESEELRGIDVADRWGHVGVDGKRQLMHALTCWMVNCFRGIRELW